ncbi:MAG: ribonuclease III [Bdellovibrionales bacterium GWC1_52_8]|nr:MAG: ribonuclease III [Bdellovibrionales bacterium GWB1_52_6]OFZ06141.1 MAG: ribonuclease III [Bdellovibrionales bacterium GWA1_52_35]OFZ40259.1 MAG: ribonuclease III [Bdellovibrionales bacterium GWC1_52_8]
MGCLHMSEKKISQLLERLGYEFGDRRVLLQSLTHTSYGYEYLQDETVAMRDNERLEFLGDAILDLVVSDILLEAFPNANEGQLSKMRAAVVNERTLAGVAKSVGLQDFVRLGKGEAASKGNEKPSILSSTLEALIAAVYLDGGFNAVYPVVRHLFAPLFIEERDLMAFYDHKTQLQEMVQARWKVTPSYHLLRTEGPDHAKTFEVEVRISGKRLATATGNSKKEAEQNAAKNAIQTAIQTIG